MAGGDGARTVTRGGPVVCRSRPVDVSPWTALRAFAGPRVAWAAPGGPTVVGCGLAERITADGPGRFAAVRESADALLADVDFTGAPGVDRSVPAAARPRLLGGLAFHDAAPADPWWGFPAAAFALPRFLFVEVDGETWLTAVTTGSDADPESTAVALESAAERVAGTPTTRTPPPGIVSVRRTPSRETWRSQVRHILERVEAGAVEKVVLAGTLTARLRGPLRLADTLARLEAAAPDCYRFAVDPGLGAAFFGASPERLLARRGDRVETQALAGSVGRGGTPEEDDRLARELTGTPRLRHEHDLVADAIGEQLAGLAADLEIGDVGVRKLGSVQHLETPIAGTLREPTHALDLAAALHPTPAVGGLPPEAASRLISETESFDRGWYAGPVGWFDAEGDGEFAVGIRSAVVAGEEATLFAGNGIVRDSDPDGEWDELQLKYRPVLDQLRS